jgi:leucyl aminopeptidase
MTTLKTSDKTNSEILVLGVAKKSGKLVIESGAANIDTKALLGILNDLGATGKADEVTKVPVSHPRLIYFVGLGESTGSTYAHETLRRAAGAASRELAGTAHADFALPHSSSAEFAAIAEGITLGAYNFTEFRGSTKAEQKVPLKSATLISKLGASAAIKNALKRAEIIAEHTHLARDLINTPPSHLTPASFCDRIKKIAYRKGVKIEILNEGQLRSKGYGGITSVGQGSANPPRLLHISYSPAKPKKRYAFVGKGITFDSGGYALKPANGMEDMKSDMSGAAAVIAATLAIVDLKLPIAIDAYACLAENMISDNATRPSDVITIYGGKTVEVLNPDAEGRLVLADGLVRAAEDAKRHGHLDGIFDVATLTGAQVVALGTRTSAVMTNNEELKNQFLKAAEISGEAFWPMPLPEELRASLDSPTADIANIGDRFGGMLVAGLFLREFVSPDQPWVHLDIAGPAYNTAAAHGYTTVGGTGIALRSLVTLAELAASQE